MGRPKGSRNRPGHSAGGYRANSGRKSKHLDRYRRAVGGGAAGISGAAAVGGYTQPPPSQEDIAAAASAAATAASVAAAVVDGVSVGVDVGTAGPGGNNVTVAARAHVHDTDALANAILDHTSRSADHLLPPMPALPDRYAASAAAGVGVGVGGMQVAPAAEAASSPRGQKRNRRSAFDQDGTNNSSEPKQERPRQQSADEQWNAMFRALHLHAVTHNGSTSVKLTPETRSLYHWVHNQCTAYRYLVDGSKNTSMTPERVAKLASIGLNLEERTGKGRGANSTKWEAKFEQLVRYRERHGGKCDVPYNYADDRQFGKWCDRQKYWYRLMKEGKKSQMTEERAKRLEGIGLVGPNSTATTIPASAAAAAGADSPVAPAVLGISTNASTVGLTKHAAKWEASFAELLQYKSQYGDCMVKYNHDNTKLARWVDRQRYWYRMMKGGKKSQMTEERAKRLAQVGFVFYVRTSSGEVGISADGATNDASGGGGSATSTSRESKWDARLAQLLEYKARTGNLNVPHNYQENPALSNWVESKYETCTSTSRYSWCAPHTLYS